MNETSKLFHQVFDVYWNGETIHTGEAAAKFGAAWAMELDAKYLEGMGYQKAANSIRRRAKDLNT